MCARTATHGAVFGGRGRASLQKASPHVPRRAHVLPRPLLGLRLGPQRLHHVARFDELEREGFQRGGRRHDDRARLARLEQLFEQRLGRGAEPVVAERVHLLLQHRAEALAQHGARKFEQRPRHHLQHQVLAVAQQQGQQRPDDGRLAGAHEHLVAPRGAVRDGALELPHQLDLRLAQQYVLHELEQQHPRVVAQAAVVGAPDVKPLRRQQRCEPPAGRGQLLGAGLL